MHSFPPALQRLVRELSKLPSIGEKSATRLAYHLLSNDRHQADALGSAIKEAIERVRLCSECFFLTEQESCAICSNPLRDEALLCVVEKPMDVVAMERGGDYRGRYHVLHGLWAPLRGQGPDRMKLKELIARLRHGRIQEVILATGSTVEGDATALYMARLINELGITTSRLAQGMPKGAELEYADDLTLSRALAGRNVVNS